MKVEKESTLQVCLNVNAIYIFLALFLHGIDIRCNPKWIKLLALKI